MSWLFSQALVGASSADISSDGEPCAQLNVMPTAQPFWRNDKTMEPSRLSRFGLTLRLLTERDGEELLTSFLAGFPARTSALPEGALESTAPAQDSGSILPGWFAKYDHEKSTWRTAQRSLLEDLESYSETWPRWGSMLNGVSYRPPTAEPTTSGSESGLLPTLTVCGNYNRKGASKTSGDGLITALNKLLPTLTARDHKSDSCSPEYRAQRDSMAMGKTLPWVLGGLLNPPWCEAFMGWPIGWTELKPLETDRFQEWQQQHGGCSVPNEDAA
jgi:hypothetical protein